MALDKVVDSSALDAGMTVVADAIRAKAGTTEPLVWPDGFKAAVEGIESGAGDTNYLPVLIGTQSGEYVDNITTETRQYAFGYNSNLTRVKMNALTVADHYTFRYCAKLQCVDLGASAITKLGFAFFGNDGELTAVIIRSNTVPTIPSTNVFLSTPIESGTGYIYVPAALVDSYKVATNWATYADQIRAIEDYPEITGG